jgi:hypothetical protein
MTTREIFRTLRGSMVTRTVLAGMLAGFIGMCLLGRQAARTVAHKDFVRFTQYTSPESKYYPTVSEMMSIVRSKIKPGQILVVVGGNSILRGVAQLPDQLWSQKLQEKLGDGYCVVNFAFNSSLITDAASVVAEALSKEFPRQIYIANAAPTQAPTPGGSNVYRWVYWDAYYKGLLLEDAPRAKKIAENIKGYPFNAGIQELRISAWLDSWCYFNDFWNDVAYQNFNTVWGTLMPGLFDFLKARKDWRDPEPDGSLFPLTTRFPAATIEGELANIRGNSQYAFNKQPDGTWQIYLPLWDDVFQKGIQDIFPPQLKARTLILLSGTSTYYTRRLTEDERYRDKITYEMAVQRWKQGGFEAMEYGREFALEDFFDRTHLTRSGALQLAEMVAPKVREMAQKLGYLKTP